MILAIFFGCGAGGENGRNNILTRDPLHLWKNGRTRLLFNQIVVNPFDDGSSISAEKMNQILQLGPILTDHSSIGKMRDGYATSLFTFANSLKMIESGDVTSFFYILLFALWNDAILNKNINPETRKNLLLILLGILITIFNKQTKKLPENVGFKKNEDKKFVTIFSQAKLKRWIPTVAVLAFEIENGNFCTGVERIGSHCIEQIIGIIRVLCRFDHRLEKIVRSAAVFTLIGEIMNELFPSRSKRTRLNSGGCKLFEGKKDISFEESHLNISEIILGLIGYNDQCEEKEIDNFIITLIKFVEEAPYPKSSLPSHNSNRSILDRYHSQKPPESDFHPQIRQRFSWTFDDDVKFDSCLMQNNEKELFTLYSDRKKRSIRLKIHERKMILSRRPLEMDEIRYIDKCIYENIHPSKILQFLKFRTVEVVRGFILIRHQQLQSLGFIPLNYFPSILWE